MTEKTPNPWRCDACHKIIPDHTGYLLLGDPGNPGGYPHWTDFDEQAYHSACKTWHDTHPGAVSVWELETYPEIQRCSIAAYHRKCDPHPDGIEYHIEIEEIQYDYQMVDWLGHLLGKVWFGSNEAVTLIRRFQHGTGGYPVRADELGQLSARLP